MTRYSTALCLASLLAVATGSFAQQPAGGAATAAQQPSGTITLTGCLDRANDGTYELLNATLSSGSSRQSADASVNKDDRATGTSGAGKPPTAGDTGVTTTWILKSTTDLAPHVGHSVEVTGRASAPSSSTESDAAAIPSPKSTASGARLGRSEDDAQSVDVQTVRMISRSCP